MAAYQLTLNGIVIRNSDGASIPSDPANRDRAAYTAWLLSGGVPDPYVAPPQQPLSATIDAVTLRVLFNHENRIRVLEGKFAVTAPQFQTALLALLGG